MQHARAELEELTPTDGLTRLTNRRHFDRQIQHEVKRVGRLRVPVSLLLINIDQFRLINEHFGSVAGDHLLRTFADLL